MTVIPATEIKVGDEIRVTRVDGGLTTIHVGTVRKAFPIGGTNAMDLSFEGGGFLVVARSTQVELIQRPVEPVENGLYVYNGETDDRVYAVRDGKVLLASFDFGAVAASSIIRSAWSATIGPDPDRFRSNFTKIGDLPR